VPALASLAAALLLAAPASVVPAAVAPRLAGPAAAAPASAAAERVASPNAYAHYLRARAAEARGDWAGVTEELRQALAFDPGCATLHAALAEAWARAGQLARAEAEARQAVELDPGAPAAAEGHLLLGRLAMAARRGPEAAAELRESIRIQNDLARGGAPEDAVLDPEAWRLLAQVELEAGREAAAALVLEDLADRLPAEGAGALRDLASHFAERRDDGRAERYLRQALARERRDPETWRRLGQLLERRHRLADARLAWAELLREEPEDPEALLAAGRLALRAADPAAARAWLAQLLVVARDEPAARVAVAFAWLDARRPVEAQEVVAKGLEAFPGDPRLRYAEGTVLVDQRRFAAAAEAFAAVAGEDEDLVTGARAGQALALVQAGHPGLGLSVADAALRRQPGEPRLVRARALALERAGRRAEALVALEAAVAARPRDEGTRMALAMAHDRAGDREAAVRVAEALLALVPDSVEAMNFLAYTWASSGQRLEDAERLAALAVEREPDNAAFLDSLGWVYHQRGDDARAVVLLERAEALAGNDPTILEHLGDAYRRARRGAEAARAYERAISAFDGGAEPETPGQRGRIERKLGELRAGETRPARRSP
jgi:tetratricopeptide (TPR) repeat protein